MQGFRAFGKNPQKLDFTSSLAVVWAPNSQGKTSLAEAFEFLLTGTTVRCDLLASSQDEFANSLRNAPVPKSHPVYVQAQIAGGAGEFQRVVRLVVVAIVEVEMATVATAANRGVELARRMKRNSPGDTLLIAATPLHA